MWIQLQIKSTAINAETTSDYLLGLGAAAVTLYDAQNQALLEPGPGEMPLWDEAWVSGLFAKDVNVDILLQQLRLLLSQKNLVYRINTLEDKEWSREWLRYFQPLQFGQHLWVSSEEQLSQIQDPEAIHVILNPGLAFGTGSHPTTALCLQWLAENLQPEQTVIDYGCGSGILAIAACKLGAQKVYATDNDPQALTATQTNRQRNHIPATQLLTMLPEDLPAIQADVVIANILANPLIALADTLNHLVKPQGQMILSGILVEQVEQLQQAYEPHRQLKPLAIKDGWVCLVN